MLIPIYEFLQTYGDAVITTFDASLIKMYGKDTFDVRKDVYEPLLKKAYNFWKQIGNPEYYTDTDGNARYEKGKCSLNAGSIILLFHHFHRRISLLDIIVRLLPMQQWISLRLKM